MLPPPDAGPTERLFLFLNLVLRHELQLHRRRHRLVVRQRDGVAALPSGHRVQPRLVAVQLRLRRLPEATIGDITGDLSAKRGLVSGTRTAQAGSLTVVGQAPQSELNGYQSRLNAMTSGQGRYTLALSHYQAVPPAVQQQLVGQYQAKDDD